MTRRVLLSSVSSDAHTWNLVYLQLALRENGNEVDNLGACVPDQLLVSHAERTQPDVIVLSSVNGHGYADGMRVIERLRAQDRLRATPVVIGGKLTVDGELGPRAVRSLRAAGFDAVFGDEGGLDEFLAFVAAVPVSAADPARSAAS